MMSRPGNIRLKFEGADRLEIDARGNLVTAGDGIRQRKPFAYQEANGCARRSLAIMCSTTGGK